MLKNKITTAIAAILITIFVAYYLGNKGSNDQKSLYNRVKQLSAQGIVSIEIIRENSEANIIIVNPFKIEEIKNLLRNVDKTIVGGHNAPTEELVLIFNLNNSSVEKLFASSYSKYDFNKDALYLLDLISRNKIAAKPVRVPELGKIITELLKK